LAKRQRRARRRGAADTALMRLPELGFLGLHHGVKPSNSHLASGGVAARTPAVAFSQSLVLRHRIVLEDFALEDPDLDAAGAERGERGGNPVIDVGTQCVQRHAALAVPLHARDFRAAQAAGAVDADALGAEPHRRLHGALHGAAERDATLELLGDRFGDQGRVELGFADLDDVEHDVGRGDVGDLLAQLVDVGALLADHYARTRRMDGGAALVVRALDHDARNGGLLQFLVQDLADLDVLVQQLAVLALSRKPARVPGPVDAETQPDRIDLLTHRFL